MTTVRHFLLVFEAPGLPKGSLKGLPNRPKINLRSRLGLLGASWALLGRSWPLLGRSWALLGGSWAALGRLLGAQEAPKRPRRRPERLQDGPKGPAKRPQEQAPGRQRAPPRRDGKTSARSARETASPETTETREIYHETTTPRYRERLTFTATPPDHGQRERFTTRPPDHGHRDRCTFSAGAPDHGKRARFTVGPPDKRGNLGGQPLHQLLFQTPLSVFSQVR